MIESDYPAVPLPTEPYHETVLRAIKRQMDTGKNKIAFKDVACAVIPNLWHYSSFFLGVALRGGAVSGASAMFTDYELQRQFVDSGAKVVLTSEHYLEKVLRAAKQSPNVKLVIYIPESDHHPVPSGVVSWNDVMKTRYTAAIPKPHIDVENDMVILPYSRWAPYSMNL
ncbi:unnamed protein product [Heligmosomoides polygyrus]|uniref:AMP-binding domain-containing protein n=1 Tax=Heligmosomoides polygyrus TaxID=6339 RepID=A0A183F5J9_HELPZ|nr:unnamed protein product [Heligmosomoides polygyrus]